jgi:hypothetical protein
MITRPAFLLQRKDPRLYGFLRCGAKLRRPCRRYSLVETEFVDPAEETDKVPFAIVLAINT